MGHLVLNEHMPALKPFAEKYLKYNVIEFSSNKAEAGNFGTTDPRSTYIYACFSADTKFMTKTGWKTFDEISDDEEIAQWNPDTNYLEFVKPIRRFDFTSDSVVGVESRAISMCVTSNHRVFGRNNIRRSWRTAEASEWFGKSMQFKTSTLGYLGTSVGDFSFKDTLYSDGSVRGKGFTIDAKSMMYFLEI